MTLKTSLSAVKAAAAVDKMSEAEGIQTTAAEAALSSDRGNGRLLIIRLLDLFCCSHKSPYRICIIESTVDCKKRCGGTIEEEFLKTQIPIFSSIYSIHSTTNLDLILRKFRPSTCYLMGSREGEIVIRENALSECCGL